MKKIAEYVNNAFKVFCIVGLIANSVRLISSV